MKTIYLDNAATTAVDKNVLKSMVPYFSKNYGNPSEFHKLGMNARSAIENSRKNISSFLKCEPEEIIFTSSSSESINLAIKGYTENLKIKPHIITTKIEHKAVLETCLHLEATDRAEVTYLDVDKYGQVSLESVKKAIKNNTALVSVMYVNNEVGTLQPIVEIGNLIKEINKNRKNKIVFHTDATQAIGHFNCDVNKLKVDLLSFSGHKVFAPKGIGVLYKKKNIEIVRQMDGGMQENGLRSGTENVPYIVGIGHAIEQIVNDRSEIKIKENCRYLIQNVLKIPSVVLTGHPKLRAPHIASFIVSGVEGESIVLRLSEKKIYISSGSACTSSSLSPSHVLTAMGFKAEETHGSVRFSLGKQTTRTEIDTVLSILPKIINNLREMSPLN